MTPRASHLYRLHPCSLYPHYFDWSFNRFDILLQFLMRICATYVGVVTILVLYADSQLRYSRFRYVCHPMPPFV